MRGRFDSEGVYYPFLNEGPDGFDTQEWIGGAAVVERPDRHGRRLVRRLDAVDDRAAAGAAT